MVSSWYKELERTKFEELQVYQLAEKLADEIWQIVQEWNQFAKDTMGKQIVRSADSIGANIAVREAFPEGRDWSV